MKKLLITYVIIIFALFVVVALFTTIVSGQPIPRAAFQGHVWFDEPDSCCTEPSLILWVKCRLCDYTWETDWNPQTNNCDYWTGAHGAGYYNISAKFTVNEMWAAYGDTDSVYYSGSGTKWVDFIAYSFTPVEDTLH